MIDANYDRLAMFQKVQGFHRNNQVQLDTLPILSTMFNQLNDNLNLIYSLMGIASQRLTGFTKDKKVKKEVLINAYTKLSIGYCMWAQLNGLDNEAERFGLSMSALNAKRDNDLYRISQNLHTIALPQLPALAPFGVLPIDFDNLLAASETFMLEIESPKTEISNRAAKNKELDATIRETSLFIKEKLDRAMRLMQFSQPFLYSLYKEARKIDSTGKRYKPDYQGTIKPTELKLIAELPYQAKRFFNIKNKGNATLQFALSNVPNQIQGKPTLLEPGKKTAKLSSSMNEDPGANFLVVKNLDGKFEGSYWVKMGK